ncbi:MAG: phosphoribosylglycinamide formyltransferase, partial [Candidatus Omnitrophica bacterium]|nr:phosphoribosylglycinamide formyltransferase [Candidatus Omnitrophota bacterium]
MNFAVLASGNGSNLAAIIKALKKKKIKASLNAVISDKESAYALTRARKANIKTVAFINPKDFSSREAFDARLLEILRREK